jgi:hypothetical protein
LADRGQPLAVLLAGEVLRLVGVLDLGQVQVEQFVQRRDGGHQAGTVPRPALPQRPHQPGADARQGDVGVKLVEPDLDVPPADPPAPDHVLAVVGPGEQLPHPAEQTSLESIDLLLAAGNDAVGTRVTLYLGVAVVDERPGAFAIRNG